MKALLIVPLLLSAACQRPSDVDVLAANPERLQVLREHCRDHHEHALCRVVAQADLQRFLSGDAGPDEYRNLADVPAMPPTFDEPIATEDAP